MFLGGSVDRHPCAVPADPIRPDRPRDLQIIVTPVNQAEEVYELRRCESGPWVWWTYVMVGYDPTPGELIATNPNPFYRN